MLGDKFIIAIEEVLATTYPDLEMAGLVSPIPGITADLQATTWTQDVYDISGTAEEYNNLTMSAPPVASRKAGTIGGNIRRYASSFQWMPGAHFDPIAFRTEAAAAREFVERAVDAALKNGNSLSGGIKGLFNQSNGLTSNAQVGSTNTNWSAMTGAQLYDDLVNMELATAIAHPGVAKILPNRLLVSPTAAAYLEKFVGTSTTSVRNLFLARNGLIKRIDTANALAGATYVMAYNDAPDVVGAVLPQAPTLRGQVPQGYGMSDEFTALTGGVYAFHPKAIHKRTISGF